MAKRSDTDKAIRNIMGWADRPEWMDERSALLDAHLAPACDRLGIGREELSQEIEEYDFGGMLFGIMFEDLLSRRLPPDEKNIVDEYLERRGWRESVPGQRYLKRLRDSVLSLYEVVEVSPGQHCDVRDLVRGGEDIRVHEHMGTQELVKWDRLAARVLKSNGKNVFAGGLLPFSHEAAQSLLKALADSTKRFDKENPRATGTETVALKLSAENRDDRFLRDACPSFTSVWLIHTLERLHAPLPELTNRDGEALMFTETRFPFLAENLEDIAKRLDTAAEWERDSPHAQTWIWLPEPDANVETPQRGLALETFRGGQRPIGGTLELTPGVLTLTSNSMERATRGNDTLEALLHGLIGPGLITLQTPDQLMAENDTRQHGNSDREPQDNVDPKIAAAMIHTTLDQHYRRCLDEPIPALDNKTPRQCATSKKGRDKVIEWLKHLENNELHLAAKSGREPYNSSWMWVELKLAKYRNC
jgi:hypothetical protein